MTLRMGCLPPATWGPGEANLHEGLIIAAKPRVSGAQHHFTPAQSEHKHQRSTSKPHEGHE